MSPKCPECGGDRYEDGWCDECYERQCWEDFPPDEEWDWPPLA